jgi:hypothetical protein
MNTRAYGVVSSMPPNLLHGSMNFGHGSGARGILRLHPQRGRWKAALISGSVAIVLNTLVLEAADRVPLATAKGGLLRLLASVWLRYGAPAPDTPLFRTGFHLFVGILMALFYSYVVDPLLPGRDLYKGVIYAIVVWTINAAFVLPAAGEGFAGSAHLTIPGIAWYATAHTLFFVSLAMIYGRLRRRSSLCAHGAIPKKNVSGPGPLDTGSLWASQLHWR